MKSHVKVNRTVLTLSKCSVMLVPSFTGRAKRVGPGGSMGVVLTSGGEGEGLWTDSSRPYGVGVGGGQEIDAGNCTIRGSTWHLRPHVMQ